MLRIKRTLSQILIILIIAIYDQVSISFHEFIGLQDNKIVGCDFEIVATKLQCIQFSLLGLENCWKRWEYRIKKE